MSHRLSRLSLETLGTLQFGAAEAAFSRLLKQAVMDCLDRPGVKTPRKVILQLDVSPIARVDGNTIDCEAANGVITLRAKIPNYETDQISFGVQQSGDLFFNPDCPENHRQQSFLGDESE